MGLSPNDKGTEPHDTRTEIAAELGWSKGKTAQADYIWKHGSNEIKGKVKSGEETVGGAHKAVVGEGASFQKKKGCSYFDFNCFSFQGCLLHRFLLFYGGQ